ncbi:MAG TPA: hypothetical protein VNW51_04720 [Mucilaginibacter sp.]|jgi:hypothetical protein|nr:hypothetical protein [Mucilaginibacter sp.]
MKKIILSLAIALSSYCSYAQNTYPWSSTGNVGIGTTNPSTVLSGTNLTINTSGSYSSLILQNSGTDRGFFTATNGQAILGSVTTGTTLQFNTEGSARMLIDASGNVGIGTTSPQSKLHIYQAASDASGLIIQGNTINADAAQHYIAMTLDGDSGNGGGNYSQIRSYSNLYNTWGSQLAFYTTQTGVANTLAERMRIDWNGNVGIGTPTPDARLAVNGTIHTKEIKVNLTGWSDYVFKPSYRLPPLTTVKAYIDQNHHLPEIPSEAEVIKNGVNVGEMLKLQTKKIEELTLYLIDKDKQLMEQNTKLVEQQKKNEVQEDRITALEKAISKLANNQSK